MSDDEPLVSGRSVLIGGCLVIIVVIGGLVYMGERGRKHEDAMRADLAANTAAAEAKEREAAIAAKQVLVGMTREDVERALGKPDRINRSNQNGGIREQWAYDSGTYVYFGPEKVTSVEK